MPVVMLVIGTIVLALLILIAVLLLRAAAFTPHEEIVPENPLPAFEMEAPVRRLAALIQKPTVSLRDETAVDRAAFDGLIEMLPGLYPHAHAALTRERVAGYSLLYRWGGSEEGAPAVLMAHYDVVPADGAGWTHPPFAGEVEDGVVWGRGSLDTKETFGGILEAVEQLAAAGFTPRHDIYLSFGHDEEIGGIKGTSSVAALLKERGIAPAFVLDEGGAVVDNVFPGVKRPVAVIGAAEKGRTDLAFTVKGAGGHASTPPKDDPALRLARAVARMGHTPFRAFFSRTTLEMLDTLGRHTPFGLRVVFANLWLFRPLLLRLFTKNGGETSAMCRTTFAVTMLEGSRGANVLPDTVCAVANLRNAVGESVAYDVETVRRAVRDDKVELSVLFSAEPSPVSDTASPEYALLRQTVSETYPEAIVTPYVMVAQSDSRYYCPLSKNVFRFTPLALTKAERESMHNRNECLPVEKYQKCIAFYIRLIQKL